jgi:hypothetical protein
MDDPAVKVEIRNPEDQTDEANDVDQVADDVDQADDEQVAQCAVWDRELTGAEEKECAEIIGHIHFQMNHAAHLIECALSVLVTCPDRHEDFAMQGRKLRGIR